MGDVQPDLRRRQGDYLTVAAPSGYPIGSYNVLQHDHQHLSSTAHSGARTSTSGR